jgi:hypothetical protein
MGSPHGWTKQPCHGCGSTELHKKDSLCHDCKALLEDAKRINEYQHQQLADGSMVVRHCHVRHMISRPYLFDNSARWVGSRLNDELGDAWSSLLLMLLEPTGLTYDGTKRSDLITNKPDTWGTKNEGYWGREDIWLIKSKLRDALNRFDLALRLALQYSHLSGKAQGLSLLAALNDGTLALTNYEDSITKVEESIKKVAKMNQDTAKYHGPFGREEVEEDDDEDAED